MIIVNTENGAKFVNEKEAVMVCHDKKAKQVSFHTRETMQGVTINDVESVTFITDTQAVNWQDEGSEIQRLKATIEKKDKEYDQMLEHSRFMREWFFIYQNAFYEIKEKTRQAERENKGIYVSPVAIIEQAEKKYEESLKRFEEAKEKWDK